MVCLPKKEGGLGVIDLIVHNISLLLKFLHKFYSKMDLPWVKLIWDKYYSDDSLPGQKVKGSFWWRDIIKLPEIYKGLASVKVTDGTTVLNGSPLATEFSELFSFAKEGGTSFRKALSHP